MYKTYNPAVSFGTNMQTVVDIGVKINNEHKDIIGVPSNESVHSYGDYVVSETREAMISELDAMLQNSKNIIDSVDHHKRIIAACEGILKTKSCVRQRAGARQCYRRSYQLGKQYVDGFKQIGIINY